MYKQAHLEVLQLREVEDPKIKDDQGESEYPGLECSGTIESVGKNVHRWKIGDQVCALVGGGGYAEKVAVPAGQVLPVACTVWSTVFMTSRLAKGETFLIHGGSSGIGTFAIQVAKYHGIKVFVTAGSEEKLAACKNLGADVCINYKTEDFVETGGKGVDYLKRNMESLNLDGRLFIIGFMGGSVAEINLTTLLYRRLTVQAAGLRGRQPENKALIVSEVEKNVWPAIAAGKIKPVVYKSLPLEEAAEAHRIMESSQSI
ncbi:hypothetical protein ACP275_09G042000 [Erythranthe tilingii]